MEASEGIIMISLAQEFRRGTVWPTLQKFDMGARSLEAEWLLTGTAIQESRLKYRKQIGGGPALGLFQMEPDTHHDIWKNYLAHRIDLATRIRREFLDGKFPCDQDLVDNDLYATAMCRVHYMRVPKPIPLYGTYDHNDPRGIAEYWKKYYNTPLGAGTAEEFIENLEAFKGEA